MTRLLFDHATTTLIPYPRQDDEPVAGLDRTAYQVVEVIREPQPEHDPAAFSAHPLHPVVSITDPDSDDVNGTATYGWELVTIVPPTPAPDWSGFQAELLQSAAFSAARLQARYILESELPVAEGVRKQRLLRAATALSDIGAVVLAAASQQDPSLFIGAWMILRQAHLVSTEVATGMMQIATAYNLPSNLIQSLGAPEQ